MIVTLVGSDHADEEFRVHVPEDSAVADQCHQEADDERQWLDCRVAILDQAAI
ncbi:hypothetical protein ACGRHY_03120 [Streptomyces sp. HK10]|uniref:hypothetical protein n=1 Tax=Streptomyces sp. HK10 TaxID=3373255 RepID=UPI00374946C7